MIENIDNKLLEYCRDLDLDNIEIILQNKLVNVNCNDSNGMTPLLITLSQPEIIDYIIPISFDDKIKIIELLLVKGADPNDKLPIFYALENPKIVKLLLDYGANDQIPLHNKMPIDIALKNLDFNLIKILINRETINENIILKILKKIKKLDDENYCEILFILLLKHYETNLIVKTKINDFLYFNKISRNNIEKKKYILLLKLFVKNIDFYNYLLNINFNEGYVRYMILESLDHYDPEIILGKKYSELELYKNKLILLIGKKIIISSEKFELIKKINHRYIEIIK